MEQDMTKGSPFKVLIMFTLPLAIGNIFQQLYNMADTIIVGRYVGADALAAVGSTGTVMFLLNGFAQGITAGFAVLTSQRYGAKKTEGDEYAGKYFCRRLLLHQPHQPWHGGKCILQPVFRLPAGSGKQ